MSKDKAEVLGHYTFRGLRKDQPGLLKKLTCLYSKPELNEKAALDHFERMIEDMTPKRREAIYLHLTCGTEKVLVSSDITRLAMRCKPDVAKQVVAELNTGSYISGSPMEKIINCLKGAEAHQLVYQMDEEYTAKLTGLVQTADLKEAKAVLKAVDHAYARLCHLPRQIARNYRTALEYG
ncbi:hypothetical protein PG997_001506 [Apiospora hydei]|uniref:Uncharacterized protein n=1 Tax=Apiospora hydei TaxID=1337664 RepID=A0ABR1XDQ7_9PEZI